MTGPDFAIHALFYGCTIALIVSIRIEILDKLDDMEKRQKENESNAAIKRSK